MSYDNYERFDERDDDESRANWIAYYDEHRKIMMVEWKALEQTLAELPTPVTNRIIKHLEWRLDVGLDACYQDYFKPGYHTW